MKPRKPLRKVSKKRAAEMARYPQLKRHFLNTHAFCVKCHTFVAAEDRQLHHFYGRVHQLLTWVPGFRLVHSSCHEWIETHRNAAVKQGLRAPDNLFNRPSLVIPK